MITLRQASLIISLEYFIPNIYFYSRLLYTWNKKTRGIIQGLCLWVIKDGWGDAAVQPQLNL